MPLSVHELHQLLDIIRRVDRFFKGLKCIVYNLDSLEYLEEGLGYRINLKSRIIGFFNKKEDEISDIVTRIFQKKFNCVRGVARKSEPDIILNLGNLQVLIEAKHYHSPEARLYPSTVNNVGLNGIDHLGNSKREYVYHSILSAVKDNIDSDDILSSKIVAGRYRLHNSNNWTYWSFSGIGASQLLTYIVKFMKNGSNCSFNKKVVGILLVYPSLEEGSGLKAYLIGPIDEKQISFKREDKGVEVEVYTAPAKLLYPKEVPPCLF